MAERSYVVIAALGPDRPGLVARLTEAVKARGGNLEDSRMAVLGGSFGIMMLVSTAADTVDSLRDDLSALEPEVGLRITIEQTAPAAPLAGGRRVAIDVEAADREGIVHAVADLLHGFGANIVNLESTLYAAPVSGTPLFKLEVLADLPGGVALDAVAARLDELAQAEMLECRVRGVGVG